MAQHDDRQRAPFSTTLVVVVIIIAALAVAREVLIPIALAVLLTFLLAPPVTRLRRWGVPRIAAVAAVVVLAFAGIGVVGAAVSYQLIDLAAALPSYQRNIQAKVQSFELPSNGVLGRAQGVVRTVGQDLMRALPRVEPAGEGEVERPVSVVVQSERSPLETVWQVIGPVLRPLGIAAIVVVFVIFMLIEREKLRDRMIRLIGTGQLNVTTDAIDEAAQRVSRYLLMQLVVNVSYGVPVGLGLFLIGVPNAFLWGILATLLRYIPYVGAWIAALMPIALAFAVDPGWNMLLQVIALYITMELISNNVIEPWLYGRGTGMSPVAILVAAVFWTWLWGPIGLLLATPLTVCLVVLGRYVPHMEFLNVLMSDEPVLPPPIRFYQRLLAGDEDEAFELAEKQLKQSTLEEVFERLISPAIRLAEQDRHRGVLSAEKQKFIARHTRELVEAMAESDEAETSPQPLLDHRGEPVRTACLPARDTADELAAVMLCLMLRRRGVRCETIGAESLSAERVEFAAAQRPHVVCISAVPPHATSHARYLLKRLRQRMPDVLVVIGVWEAVVEETTLRKRLGAAVTDAVTTRLIEAADRIVQVGHSIQPPAPATPHPSRETGA